LEQKILPIEGKKDAKGQKMGWFEAESSAHRKWKKSAEAECVG